MRSSRTSTGLPGPTSSNSVENRRLDVSNKDKQENRRLDVSNKDKQVADSLNSN